MLNRKVPPHQLKELRFKRITNYGTQGLTFSRSNSFSIHMGIFSLQPAMAHPVMKPISSVRIRMRHSSNFKKQTICRRQDTWGRSRDLSSIRKPSSLKSADPRAGRTPFREVSDQKYQRTARSRGRGKRFVQSLNGRLHEPLLLKAGTRFSQMD